MTMRPSASPSNGDWSRLDVVWSHMHRRSSCRSNGPMKMRLAPELLPGLEWTGYLAEKLGSYAVAWGKRGGDHGGLRCHLCSAGDRHRPRKEPCPFAVLLVCGRYCNTSGDC